MRFQSPVMITPRLMAGVQIGDTFISIKYAGKDSRGANRYRYYIDNPNFEYENDDISGWGGLQKGLENLLVFLSAAGESYGYALRMKKELSETENAEIFPAHVVEWAYMNSDEISMMQIELEENGNLIQE